MSSGMILESLMSHIFNKISSSTELFSCWRW